MERWRASEERREPWARTNAVMRMRRPIECNKIQHSACSVIHCKSVKERHRRETPRGKGGGVRDIAERHQEGRGAESMQKRYQCRGGH